MVFAGQALPSAPKEGDSPPPGSRSRGFLSTLTAGELATLIAMGRPQRFQSGAILLSEGDQSRRVLLITAGRVKVSSYTEDGREVILAIRTAEDLLGEISAIDGEVHSATVSALDPVQVFAISGEDFRQFLEATPGAALRLLETDLSRLRDADRKRIEFGAYDTVGRVASRLLELVERFGQPAPNGVRVDVPLSQQELAGWVGSSREAVSKALHALRDRGWIETHRRGFTVLDQPALRRRAT